MSPASRLPIRFSGPFMPAPGAVAFRRPAAVIDIGSSSIRMAVADIEGPDGVTTYETFTQSLSLGDDTFKTGVISGATAQACIQILRTFRKAAAEYGIGVEQIRAVATSAVREAANRQSFLDRVYIATGLSVEALDDADTTRLMYLSVLPFFRDGAAFRRAHTLVVEVGGGLTEVLALKGRDIVFSRVFRLGALRLRELARATPGRRRAALEPHIRRTVQDLKAALPDFGKANLVVLGGDMRFAAKEAGQESAAGRLGRVRLRALQALADETLSLAEEEIVRRHRLPFPDAESLGPALLCNALIAEAFGVGVVRVSSITLRDGLLQEIAARGRWTEGFTRQITRSALETGRKYRFDEEHALHVAHACRRLFEQLQPEHQLNPRLGTLLEVAALLHEVGLFISSRSHHKHSMYVIQNSDLFGLGPRDTLLVALVARYHRRSPPKPVHQPYASLPRDERIVVSKLAALLRVADALCRQRGRPVADFTVERDEAALYVEIPDVSDLSLEQQALKEKGELFEEVFGSGIRFRRKTSGAG